MGLIFADEGRFGAAANSMQDALKGLTEVGDQKSRDVAETLIDLAATLARAGRLDEATTTLDTGQTIARDLKSESLSAQVLNTQGEIAFYRGEAASARQYFQKAQQTLGHREEKTISARTQLNLARVDLMQGNHKEAEKRLSPYASKGNGLPKTLSIHISITYAESLIRGSDTAHARQILLANLGATERAGMKSQTARIYYLLSLTAKTNPEEAASFSGHAIKAIDDIRGLPGSDKLLQRADLSAIYKESTATIAAAKR